MIVTSAFTPNGDYPKLARELVASCNRFGLRYRIVQVSNQPTWLETVQSKPIWILTQLLESREAVLWLDADCEIVQLPSLILGTGHDFAAFNWLAVKDGTMGYDPARLRVSGGVLYFAYTAPAIELLVRWQAEVGERPQTSGTDASLDIAYNHYRPPVDPLWLPREYNRHNNQWPEVEPVIDHKFQNRRHSDAPDAKVPLRMNMFHYADMYDQAVAEVENNQAIFVEVGCWLGDSSSYMARKIKESGKHIILFCVDTWRGSEGIEWMKPVVEACGGDMLPAWKKRMERDGVIDHARPIQKPSVEAAKEFSDNTVDFCMIDGDHRYEQVKADITAWLPKIKPGGILCGDDYDRQSHPGVPQAVDELLGSAIELRGRTWIHRKSA